ncbi:unnamed protein product [Ilex paraguariensis]|uniref:Protein BIC1 n=1 Tax=Ilex paraguariensis TaxID=185542 RepID=A0ABC8TWI8_9AQUA
MGSKSGENASHHQVVSVSSEFKQTEKKDDQIESERPFSEVDNHQNLPQTPSSKSKKPTNDATSVLQGCTSTPVLDVITTNAPPSSTEAMAEDSGRERLKRHRMEVAGRVWIPEIWGQEELLKDWTDCTAFDASLMNNSIMSARAALVEGGRNSRRLRIENRC